MLLSRTHLRALRFAAQSENGVVKFDSPGLGFGLDRSGWEERMSSLCEAGYVEKLLTGGFKITDTGRQALEHAEHTIIAWVAREAWGGLAFSKCEVIKINPKRSRVRMLEGGVGLTPGETLLVPNEELRISAKKGSPSAIPIPPEGEQISDDTC